MLTKWIWRLLRKAPPRKGEASDPYQGLPEAPPRYESGRGSFRAARDSAPTIDS